VEVLLCRMFLTEHRVVGNILNVFVRLGAIENLIDRRIRVDKTGADFPFLAARHSAGS
jgi:hypothetical protein